MRALLFALGLTVVTLVNAFPAHAQCGSNWGPGFITTPTTWTTAQSPVCIDGDLQILSTLTIAPGVIVHFQGTYNITVNTTGQIIANGTAQQPIRFVSGPANPAGWQSIIFQSSNPMSSFQHCRFSGATQAAVQVLSSWVHFDHCFIQGCSNSVNGGGLHIASSPLSLLRNTTVTGCSSSGAGGGVWIEDSLLLIEGCTFAENTSSGQGGGVYVRETSGLTLTVDDCNFTGNQSGSNGGGLRTELTNGGRLDLFESVFTRNHVNRAYSTGNYVGGGLYATNGVTCARSAFDGNVAWARCHSNDCKSTGRGGGVYLSGEADSSFVASYFRGNESHSYETSGHGHLEQAFARGGGLYFSSSGNLLVESSFFSDNYVLSSGTATYTDGSAIYIASGSAELRHITVARNRVSSASGSKSAIYGAGTLTNSIVYYNHPTPGGPQLAGGIATAVTWSCVENLAPGNNNIPGPPQFIGFSTAFGDLHVSSGSPCIDAGDPASPGDIKFPPSQGTVLPDMGATGGAATTGLVSNAPQAVTLIGYPQAGSLANFLVHAPGETGNLAWVLFSFSGISGFPVPGGSGKTVPLTFDPFTAAGINLGPLFQGIVDARGQAVTPVLPISASVPAAIQIRVAAVTLSFSTGIVSVIGPTSFKTF